MRIKRLLLLLTAGAAIVAAILIFQSNNEAPAHFSFHNGDKASFSYEMQSSLGYGSGRKTDSMTAVIEGIMNTEVIGVSEDAVVQFTFAPRKIKYDINPELYRIISTPFIVNISKTGRFTEITFPEYAEEELRYLLSSLVYPLETILSTGKNSEYAMKSSDMLGTFISRYSKSGDTIVRKKERYVKDKKNLPVNIFSSQFDIKLSHDGWIQKAEGTEHLRVAYDNYYQTETVTSIKLEKLEKYFSPAEVTYIGPKTDNKLLKISREAPKEKTTAGLTEFLNKNTGKTLLAKDIGKFLNTDEKYIAETLEMITNRQTDNQTRAKLIAALGSAGSAEAQAALISLAENTANDSDIRFKAAMAFGQIEKPLTDESVRFLMSGTDKFGTDSDEQDIGSTALLAAGIIVDNLKDGYPADSKQLNDEILRQLTSSTDPYVKEILLKSLGNTKSNENSDTAAEYLQSDEFFVRASAAETLGTLTGESAKDALIDRLAEEPLPAVTVNILNSLDKNALTYNDIAVVTEILQSSDKPDIRLAAIKLLTNHKETAEDLVNDTFKKALKSETDRENAKLMIKGYAK